MARRRRSPARKPRSARARRANRAAPEWDAETSLAVTGRDDTLTRVLASLRDDYGDDAADVDGIASTIQRSRSAVRGALKELVQIGAAHKLPASSARYYRGPARWVYRIDEDYGQAVADASAWALQAARGDAYDPEAEYLAAHSDFDPSSWGDEGPGEDPQDAGRYEVVGPELAGPDVVRWVVHDGLMDFAPVAWLDAAWGWAAAGEDRPLEVEGLEHALVALGARVRPSHRGQGLPTLLYEAALSEAWRRQLPLTSRADRTAADSKWWAKQARARKAELLRYQGPALDGGGSRYVVGREGEYPERFENPPIPLYTHEPRRRRR